MAHTVFKRFETTVLRKKSPTDPAQVPASANVDLHRPGATVRENVTVPAFTGDVPVRVYDFGRIRENDTLLVGGSTTELVCGGFADADHLLAFNNSDADVNLVAGARLIPVGDPPPRVPRSDRPDGHRLDALHRNQRRSRRRLRQGAPLRRPRDQH
jgi:hypothetical protein